MNLNLGCGNVLIKRKGWVNGDLNPLSPDVLKLDMSDLPYPDGTIDEVVSSHSLEHVKNPEQCIKEWCRVLRPGGKLVIAVPNEDKKSEWIGFHLQAFYERGQTELEDHHQSFTPDSLLKMVNENGPWQEVKSSHGMFQWTLPGKVDWQIVLEAVK